MTRAEATAFIAEKLNDALNADGAPPPRDAVFQCEPDNGSFIYYDSAQTVYDAESEASESELWLVVVFPAKAMQ